MPKVDRDFASLRGRLGYSLGNVLLYGTAGIGWEDFDSSVIYRSTSPAGTSSTTLKQRKEYTGFVGGGGVEVQLVPHILVRAEALYFDAGSKDYSFGNSTLNSIGGFQLGGNLPPTKTHVGVDEGIFRAGLAYRF